jgi:hypothetical protein
MNSLGKRSHELRDVLSQEFVGVGEFFPVAGRRNVEFGVTL